MKQREAKQPMAGFVENVFPALNYPFTVVGDRRKVITIVKPELIEKPVFRVITLSSHGCVLSKCNENVQH